MNHLRRPGPAAVAAAALVLAFSSALGQAQTAAPAIASAAKPAGPLLVAKIATSLNTKNAKPGAVLTAKTLRAFQLPDGTTIPKGSKLVASVTAVKSKKDGNGNSMLSFRFDQIEVKGGAPVPIHGMVVAIGPELGPHDDLGPHSVLSRSASTSNDTSDANRGVGSTPGLDPHAGLGGVAPKDEDDIALGSTLGGVALGRHLDADWTTALEGFHEDIDLGSDVVIKVQLK